MFPNNPNNNGYYDNNQCPVPGTGYGTTTHVHVPCPVPGTGYGTTTHVPVPGTGYGATTHVPGTGGYGSTYNPGMGGYGLTHTPGMGGCGSTEYGSGHNNHHGGGFMNLFSGHKKTHRHRRHCDDGHSSSGSDSD
ncbi:hypothetical protein RND81_09G021900 [Saponaria officinalis]|uniref:Uncharacterized protein n=1 Tax=Saponaria officinalis TaxID=3572 RepID=A0AAW1IHM3_SAPOF